VGSRILFPLTAIVLLGVFAALSLAEMGTDSGGSGVDGKITDDDGGAPLFSAAALRPGERVTNCIEIKYSGTKDAPVALAGRGSGALDQYLDVDVERGSGGSHGDCNGFSGTPIFNGTLAEFLRTGDSDESAIPAWTASESESSRAFRISVALRDVPQAEGQTASVNFEWSAPGEEEPVKPADPVDPETPATPPVAEADPKPKIKPETPVTEPRRDSPTPRASDPEPPAAGGGGAPPAADDKSFLDSVKDVAVGAGKRVAFPSFLALLGFLFILLQNRLDRRDPKLAMAPLNKDDDLLPFGPLPWAKAGS
jgi:hypothetical protein